MMPFHPQRTPRHGRQSSALRQPAWLPHSPTRRRSTLTLPPASLPGSVHRTRRRASCTSHSPLRPGAPPANAAVPRRWCDIGCWPCMPMRRHRSFRKVCSTVSTKAPYPNVGSGCATGGGQHARGTSWLRRRRMTIHRPSEVRDAPALPSRPDRSNAVDELFAEEYDAPVRQAWPVRCSATRNWKVDASAPARSFRQTPRCCTRLDAHTENYARLHGAIRRWRTAPTSPQQYRHCHYLPEWYPLRRTSRRRPCSCSRNADFEAVLAQSPWRAWFVKDL